MLPQIITIVARSSVVPLPFCIVWVLIARHRFRTEKCSQSMRFYSVMMVPPAFFYSHLETIRSYAVPCYYEIQSNQLVSSF